jgi:DNA replication protein DnaC
MQTARSDAQPAGALLSAQMLTQRESACEKHGHYSEIGSKFGGVQRWAGCPTCLQEREALSARESEASARRDARRSNLLSGWQGAQIPKRFESASFETYLAETPAQRAVLDGCREYADQWEDVSETGRNLILCGLYGTGKTHLSVSIARAIARRGALPLFARTYEVVQFVRESYRAGSSMSEREAIRQLVEPDLLILDEVGVQGGGDNEQMILFAILNGRYDAQKPTIVVSNEDIGGIEKYLTVRVVDRLREGGAKVFVFDWESYRRRAKTA